MKATHLLIAIISAKMSTANMIYMCGANNVSDIDKHFQRVFPDYTLIDGELFAGQFIAMRERKAPVVKCDACILFDGVKWYLYKID